MTDLKMMEKELFSIGDSLKNIEELLNEKNENDSEILDALKKIAWAINNTNENC